MNNIKQSTAQDSFDNVKVYLRVSASKKGTDFTCPSQLTEFKLFQTLVQVVQSNRFLSRQCSEFMSTGDFVIQGRKIDQNSQSIIQLRANSIIHMVKEPETEKKQIKVRFRYQNSKQGEQILHQVMVKVDNAIQSEVQNIAPLNFSRFIHELTFVYLGAEISGSRSFKEVKVEENAEIILIDRLKNSRDSVDAFATAEEIKFEEFCIQPRTVEVAEEDQIDQNGLNMPFNPTIQASKVKTLLEQNIRQNQLFIQQQQQEQEQLQAQLQGQIQAQVQEQMLQENQENAIMAQNVENEPIETENPDMIEAQQIIEGQNQQKIEVEVMEKEEPQMIEVQENQEIPVENERINPIQNRIDVIQNEEPLVVQHEIKIDQQVRNQQVQNQKPLFQNENILVENEPLQIKEKPIETEETIKSEAIIQKEEFEQFKEPKDQHTIQNEELEKNEILIKSEKPQNIKQFVQRENLMESEDAVMQSEETQKVQETQKIQTQPNNLGPTQTELLQIKKPLQAEQNLVPAAQNEPISDEQEEPLPIKQSPVENIHNQPIQTEKPDQLYQKSPVNQHSSLIQDKKSSQMEENLIEITEKKPIQNQELLLEESEEVKEEKIDSEKNIPTKDEIEGENQNPKINIQPQKPIL